MRNLRSYREKTEREFIKFALSEYLENRVMKHSKENSFNILNYGSGTEHYNLPLCKQVNYICVDLNERIVRENLENGIPCMEPSRFYELDFEPFDIVILSHVIEHMDYGNLFSLFKKIVSHMKENSFLIIMSPYLNQKFYNDFDHVKPYTPEALNRVFCGKKYDFQEDINFNLKLLYCVDRYEPFFIEYRDFYKTWKAYRFIMNRIFQVMYSLGIKRKMSYMAIWVL